MAAHSAGREAAGAAAPSFVLDRIEAIPKLIGKHEDFLIVTGLAGTSRDIAALTHDGAHTYSMAGAMGGACMIGLGLALARRDKRVLVVTGDGELLMNLGSLATIAVLNPPNLSVICVDNGHYGETGYQKSHTSLGVDLEKIAAGSGMKRTMTIEKEGEIAAGSPPDPRGQRLLVRAAARQAHRAPQLQARPRPRHHPHALPRRKYAGGVEEAPASSNEPRASRGCLGKPQMAHFGHVVLHAGAAKLRPITRRAPATGRRDACACRSR